jgi:hypothetical protein
MATTKTAELIRGKDFNAAVDKALAIAASRHHIAMADDRNFVVNWDLVGRRIKDDLLADKFAADVAKQLGSSGIKAVPATLKFNKWIWVGFYERNRIPVIREIGF